MNETKPWWQSKATIGSLVVVAASAFGISEGLDVDSLATQIVAAITALGGIWTFIGRIAAKKGLTF